MTGHLCLFTDSLEPSGVGEQMLTLASELRGRYRISFVCPPSPTTPSFVERASRLGIETAALRVGGEPAAEARFQAWLRAARVEILHGHAGISWEGHAGMHAARAAGVPVVLRTEHLPYLITDPEQRAEHAAMVPVVDRIICVSEAARRSFLEAGVPASKLRVVRNGVAASKSHAPSLGSMSGWPRQRSTTSSG